MPEVKFLTILNFNMNEVNTYKLQGEMLEKFLSMDEEDFIREIIELNPDELSWMISSYEPYTTYETL